MSATGALLSVVTSKPMRFSAVSGIGGIVDRILQREHVLVCGIADHQRDLLVLREGGLRGQQSADNRGAADELQYPVHDGVLSV